MRKLILLGMFTLVVQVSNACDICGCSHGGYFVGTFPDFHRHFIGLRYSFRNYYSHNDTSSEYSRDRYQALELWGGISLGRRWQLMVFVPFKANRQETDDGGHQHTHYGLGDATLLANYLLLQREKNQVWLGAGVKIPTGKFSPEDGHELVPAANMEPGSGSTDLVFSATDVYQSGKWSMYGNVSYSVNREAKAFQFGNQLNASALVARSFDLKGANLVPNAGLYYEHLAANKQGGQKIEATGGQALLASGGIDLRLGKINIGMNAQLPLAQNFSNNQTSSRLRGMVQVVYMF
jgi:hypothetical protein